MLLYACLKMPFIFLVNTKGMCVLILLCFMVCNEADIIF